MFVKYKKITKKKFSGILTESVVCDMPFLKINKTPFQTKQTKM